MNLVIGASGFLGSHVTQQLVARGDEVRLLIGQTSSTNGLSDLHVEYDYGSNSVSVRLLHNMPPMDHTKGMREPGWRPSPTPDSIRKAAHFYDERGRGAHGGQRSHA